MSTSSVDLPAPPRTGFERAWHRLFPEAAAGGFGRLDPGVEFYSRVNALLGPDHVVVDFGAGRGEFMDKPPSYRRDLQLLRGKVRTVIGVDIDPVVMTNPSVDNAIVWTPGRRIDLPDESVDLVISDYTFEHVDDPSAVVAELGRILKPGGWICARTPNRWGIIAIAARMVPNRLHTKVLRTLEPSRQSRDVFPTRYRLNTLHHVRRAFASTGWHVHGVATGEPAYVGGSRVLLYTMFALLRLLPMRLQPMYLFFVQKQAA